METLIIVIAVLLVGSFAIKLVSGALRIGLIVILAVVLFGGGWATVENWGNDMKDRVEINVKDSPEDSKKSGKNKGKNRNK